MICPKKLRNLINSPITSLNEDTVFLSLLFSQVCVWQWGRVVSCSFSTDDLQRRTINPLQETWCFWSMVPYIFSPAEWYSSWLIREVPSCIHLLGAAVPGLFHSRTKVPRKWVVFSSPGSWAASLAVANHFDYFGIWFPLTPVTVDSVNTHVKYYLGILKCLTAVASCQFVRGTRICIIPVLFSSLFPPSFCREGCGWRAWWFFCHLSQHQGIPRQQVEFLRDSSKGGSFSPS